MEKQGNPNAWKNFLQLGAAQGLSMVLALILKVYLPRVLGLEKSGQIFFAESLILIYFSFLPLGIGYYIFREIPKNPDQARHIIRPIMIIETVFFLMLMGIMLLQLHLQKKDATTISFVLIFALGNFFGLLCFQIFRPIFLCLNKVSFVAVVDSLAKGFLAVLLVICLFFSSSLIVLAWASVFATLLTFAIYINRLLRDSLWGGQINRAFLRDIIVHPLPYFIHGALIAVYMNMDVTFLGMVADAAETGIYGASFRLIGIFLLFVPLVASSIMPVLSRLLGSDIPAYSLMLQQILRVILAISGLLVFPLILLADELIGLLYGSEFAVSAGVVRLLGPTLILAYCNVILSQHLTLATNGRALIFVTVVSIVLDLGLNSLLIAWGLQQWGAGGGAMGVALTNVVSETFVFLAYCGLSRAYLNISVLIRRVFALIVPQVVLIYVLQLGVHGFWIRAALAFLAAPLFLSILGFIRREDWQLVNAKLKKLRR